jgi:small nuclear ribonucleoprotein D1
MRSWILPESLNLDALLVDDAPTKTKTVVDAAGAGRGRGRGRGRGGRR